MKGIDVHGLPEPTLVPLTDLLRINTTPEREENDCCYICQSYTANEKVVAYEGYWDKQFIVIQNHQKTYCSSCRNWYYTHQQVIALRIKAEKVLEAKVWIN